MKRKKKAPPTRKKRPGPGRPLGDTILERRGMPLVEVLIANIRTTDSIPTSANACGIGSDAVYEWKVRGEVDIAEDRPETIFAILAEGIKKARADFELDKMKIIERAAEKNWQAAAWQLERRRPEFKRDYEPPADRPDGDVKVMFINELPPEPKAKK